MTALPAEDGRLPGTVSASLCAEKEAGLQGPFAVSVAAHVTQNNSGGVRAHTLTEWRLEPPP